MGEVLAAHNFQQTYDDDDDKEKEVNDQEGTYSSGGDNN